MQMMLPEPLCIRKSRQMIGKGLLFFRKYARIKKNDQKGQMNMAEIRIATGGRMTYYRYTGDELTGALFQLFCEKDGAVIVSKTGQAKKETLPPDSPYLADALQKIEALLAENPDCGCVRRPMFNEVLLTDGTLRFVPHDALNEILETLFRQACADAAVKELHPAGAVAMDTQQTAPLPYIKALEEQVGMQGLVACQPPQQNGTAEAAFHDMLMTNFGPKGQSVPPEPVTLAAVHPDGSWDCACGITGLTSKFCYQCGAPKPVIEWKCICGSTNTGKFCRDCGTPRP